MIRLGVAFSGGDPVAAVERVAALGVGVTVPWVDLQAGVAPINPALDRARALGVRIPGLNAYANLVHPDPTVRAWNIEQIRTVMQFAAENSLDWVNTMAGTRETNYSFWAYHPDNFSDSTWQTLVAAIRELLDTTPAPVKLALEPYMMTPLGTTASLRRIIDEVDSNRLRIKLDPVNLIEPREYPRAAEVVESMVLGLTACIVGADAKDHFMHRQKATVQIDERVPGEGEFPYPALLRALDQVPGDPTLIIEHLREDEQLAGASRFIRSTAEAAGVSLE